MLHHDNIVDFFFNSRHLSAPQCINIARGNCILINNCTFGAMTAAEYFICFGKFFTFVSILKAFVLDVFVF